MLKKIPRGELFWTTTAVLFPLAVGLGFTFISPLRRLPILLQFSMALPADIVVSFLITNYLRRKHEKKFFENIEKERKNATNQLEKFQRVERLKRLLKNNINNY